MLVIGFGDDRLGITTNGTLTTGRVTSRSVYGVEASGGRHPAGDHRSRPVTTRLRCAYGSTPFCVRGQVKRLHVLPLAKVLLDHRPTVLPVGSDDPERGALGGIEDLRAGPMALPMTAVVPLPARIGRGEAVDRVLAPHPSA